MPSPVSADQPAATPPGRGSVDALISQTRRLMGDVDAVRREARGDSAAPLDRWQRALYDLALHQLNDLDEHLAQLREGPPDLPDAVAPDAGPPRGSLLSRVGSAEWNLLTDEASWSAELYRIVGREPGTAPLTLDELPSLVLAADRPKLTTMVTDCLVDASPIDGEFRLVRPDGTVRTVHMMGEPVLDGDGGAVAMWAVLRDVSELRRSQRTVTDSRASLGRPEVAALPPAPGPQVAWHASSLRAPGRGPGHLDVAAHLPDRAGGPHPGDWHDALELVDGDSLLSLGSLRGEGAVDTAGAMLLGALRGMATTGAGPGRLLVQYEQLRTATLAPTHGTAVCCRYHPPTRTLVWARTGGPAPLLFRDGTGRVLGARDDGTVNADTPTVSTPNGSRPDSSWPDGGPEQHGTLPGRSPSPTLPEVRETLRAGDVVLLRGGTGTAEHRLLALAPDVATAPTAHDCLRILADEPTPAAGHATDAPVLVVRVTD
ncbi:PAS domain-containing protein [Streptomyces sp. NPDC090306]|uniref:PAS domain-containing protein n=1 Tax=Streptomyces sp. NPDC090306 TaxID=3365961 RepID=UPI0038194FE3